MITASRPSEQYCDFMRYVCNVVENAVHLKIENHCLWLLRFLERTSALVMNCKRLKEYAKEEKENLLQYVQKFRSVLSGLDGRCTNITETFKKNGLGELKRKIRSCMEASESELCEWSEEDINFMMQYGDWNPNGKNLDNIIKDRIKKTLKNDKDVMSVINDYLKELDHLSEDFNEAACKLILSEPMLADKSKSKRFVQNLFSLMKILSYILFPHKKYFVLQSGISMKYIPENECKPEKSFNDDLVSYMKERSSKYVKLITGSWLSSVAAEMSADIQSHAKKLMTDIQKGIKALDTFSESVSYKVMRGFKIELFETITNKCRKLFFLNVMKHEIHSNRLIIDEQNLIGQGTFGCVRGGLLKEENGSIQIAAKIIQSSDLQTIFGECFLMRQLMLKANTAKGGESPPVVRYFGSMYSKNDVGYELILVMELCNTDLRRQIETGFLTPSNVANAVLFPGAARRTTPRATLLSSSSYALDIAIQAAKGLRFVHENGIVHRDVKPSNFLVSFREKQVFVKITDVGVSKEYNIITTRGQHIGTPLYHSPEIRLNPLNYHSPACDVYSFGLVLWEVWYGRRVFHEIPLNQLEKHITLNTPDFNDYYPPAELKELIEACWNRKPRLRPDMKTIVQKLTKLAAKK